MPKLSLKERIAARRAAATEQEQATPIATPEPVKPTVSTEEADRIKSLEATIDSLQAELASKDSLVESLKEEVEMLQHTAIPMLQAMEERVAKLED